jgi:hypothetical protein
VLHQLGQHGDSALGWRAAGVVRRRGRRFRLGLLLQGQRRQQSCDRPSKRLQRAVGCLREAAFGKLYKPAELRERRRREVKSSWKASMRWKLIAECSWVRLVRAATSLRCRPNCLSARYQWAFRQGPG